MKLQKDHLTQSVIYFLILVIILKKKQLSGHGNYWLKFMASIKTNYILRNVMNFFVARNFLESPC